MIGGLACKCLSCHQLLVLFLLFDSVFGLNVKNLFQWFSSMFALGGWGIPCAFKSCASCGILFYNHWKRISTNTMLMAAAGVVTFHDQPSPIKSSNPLMNWSCKIEGQTTPIISPLTLCLSTPNLVGWWLNISGSHP